MKPVVLLFNFTDKSRLNNILKAILPLKVRTKNVDKEDYLQPIGYLAGIKDIDSVIEKYDGEGLGDEMLLLAGLTDSQINKLLSSLRKAGIFIGLKAVLTANNQYWNALQLYEELKKENEAINRQM